MLIGGAATPADLLAAGARRRRHVIRTYGMSETCGGCVYDGVPLDGVRMRIDDDHQVHLAGPVLFDGYGDPAAPTHVVDGWFATDDLGEIDATGGSASPGAATTSSSAAASTSRCRPSPRRCARHEGVGDAIAVGVPDDEWGTRVVAYLVPADAVCLDGLRLDEVRDAVEAAGLPRTWAPREVVLVDALPLLPGGKVDRQALQRPS